MAKWIYRTIVLDSWKMGVSCRECLGGDFGESFWTPRAKSPQFFSIVRALCKHQNQFTPENFAKKIDATFSKTTKTTHFLFSGNIVFSIFVVDITWDHCFIVLRLKTRFFFVAPRSLATTAAWPKRAARCSGLVSSLSEASTEKPNVDKAWHPQKNEP